MTPDENTPTEAHYSRNPRVIRRQVGGETVLVPLAGPDAANLEYLYRLNATGSALWDLLEKPLSADELTDALIESHGDDAPPRETIEADVAAFLADITEAGLVSREA